MTTYRLTDESGETRFVGTISPAPGGGSQPVLSKTTPITMLQLRSLDTVPVAITDAPGAGKAVLPVGLSVVLLFGTAAYTNGFGLTVVYEGQGSLDPPQYFVNDSFCALTADSVYFAKWQLAGVSNGFTYAAADVDNARLMMWADSAVDTDGDSTLAVTCWYTTPDLS